MKEKAAYLRGLIEGLGIDETTKEGKVIKAMSELLGELAEAVDGIDEDVTRAYDQINDLSDELEDLEADPVGTGPFHYVSRSPQENIVLEKFSDYWDTENQAYLDKVTFRIVKDSNAVVTNLKSGTLDMYARLSSTQTAQLAEDSDFTIYDGGMNLVQALYLNNAVEPLNNVKVRLSLIHI